MCYLGTIFGMIVLGSRADNRECGGDNCQVQGKGIIGFVVIVDEEMKNTMFQEKEIDFELQKI